MVVLAQTGTKNLKTPWTGSEPETKTVKWRKSHIEKMVTTWLNLQNDKLNRIGIKVPQFNVHSAEIKWCCQLFATIVEDLSSHNFWSYFDIRFLVSFRYLITLYQCISLAELLQFSLKESVSLMNFQRYAWPLKSHPQQSLR